MASALDRAVIALDRGGLVVYPTETVYGIGVDAASAVALSRLAALKGISSGRGVSLLVDGLEMAASLIAGDPPPAARRLAARFWPGPLTLVLPASEEVLPWLRGPNGGVGLRCSCDPVAVELLGAAGRPLTSTSANPSGQPPAANVEQARAYFGDRVECFLDGGTREGCAASTVVEFFDGEAILRRSGAIGAEAVSSVVPIRR